MPQKDTWAKHCWLVCECDLATLNADCSKCLGRQTEKNPAKSGLLQPQGLQKWANPTLYVKPAPSSVVWFGFSLLEPESKHVGRSSAGPGGCSRPGRRQLPAGRSMLWCLERGWYREPEPLHPKTPPPCFLRPPPAPQGSSPGLRVWMMLLMLFVFGNFFKAQWFRLTNVFWFPNMFSSHLCCVFP